ncbi:MAG: protease SohB, partial [Coxiella endosymbiont of Dermacentor silvarum]
MEFLGNYSLFLAKLVSVVAFILIILFSFLNAFKYSKEKSKVKLDIRKLNDKYEEYNRILSHAIDNKHELKLRLKFQKK